MDSGPIGPLVPDSKNIGSHPTAAICSQYWGDMTQFSNDLLCEKSKSISDFSSIGGHVPPGIATHLVTQAWLPACGVEFLSIFSQ